MKIGDFHLDNNIALAPMAGVTDLPFRRLCRKLGAGYVVGEMLGSDPKLRATTKSRLRGVHREEPAPRSIQIVGWDPCLMADAARYNVDQGASIIDINMGCPTKKVCKRYAGSALLADESRVARILEKVVSAVTVPVTLKMRTGVSTQHKNGVQIAKIAESAGISALAVHGRTRACKYVGKVEFSTVRAICKAVSIPVFANGDITDYDSACKIMKFTGADGLMIGRGAHGAPWFPGQLASYFATGQKPAAPGISCQREIVLEHLDAIYRFYGAERGVRIARKHIKWYWQNYPDPGKYRSTFNCAGIPALQTRLVSDYYKYLTNSIQKAPVW
jgi:tRNA-dihydrouridine synthase B